MQTVLALIEPVVFSKGNMCYAVGGPRRDACSSIGSCNTEAWLYIGLVSTINAMGSCLERKGTW